MVVPKETRPEASRLDVMEELWRGAGLEDVETRVITVQRTYADFDDYWTIAKGGPSAGGVLAAMTAGQTAELVARLRARLSADASGRITVTARANAVRGRVAT